MRFKTAFPSLIMASIGFAGIAAAQNKAPDDSAKTANPYGRKYPPRIYDTVRLKGRPPVIDGRLDDACWSEGEWHGGFRQQIPTEGAEPSAKTELKILYDEKNIYMAMRAHDDPKLIHKYSGRRDELMGDVLGVCLDSYADKRTGFEFDLTAAGSKIDLVLMNGANDCVWDMNWDAVWDGKTAMEDSGWTAEFRVPLSQLRYGSQDEQVWGLHAWRWIDRFQEEDQWSLVPRINTGRMYNIGELHGIRGLKKFRHIEILPHVLGRVTTDPRQPGNPYATGSATMASAGLDAKIGLTSDFTLDATVNPDFGQVEADPSVMNLTAYETFYEEKRPFFLEGKNILEFSPSGGGDMLFYTRRIGHAPGFAPGLRDGEFIKTPENTSILSAVKVTGKSRDGLSLGVVQSITARETARISYQGVERDQTVEPLSNYFVGRMQKDWNKGNTSLGGIVTSAHRWIGDKALDFMPGDAVTGGLDFVRYIGNRSYRFDARAVFSRISGKPQAILALQTDPVHYFQRPGADHLGVDSSAAMLSGHGGMVSIGRIGNSKWRFSEGVRWTSPGLELNDLGFLQQADVIANDASVGYSETETGRIFREYNIGLNQSTAWDFGGLRTDATTSIDLNGNFLNRWGLSGMVLLRGDAVDTRLLRGGPAVKLSRFLHTSINGHTDFSRKIVLEAGVHKHFYADGGSDLTEFTPGLNLRFSNAFFISGNLYYSLNTNDLQYVAAPETGSGPKYLVGRIEQKTAGVTFRLSYHLTPDFSIQFYGSPFVSVGKYSHFKRVTSGLAKKYEDRFHRLGDGEIAFRSADNAYDVSEADGGAYSFGNPDFSFRQLRTNLVLRWEYRPGSVLYIVWAQQKTSDEAAWVESMRSNYSSLWSAEQHNVFLAKLSYWFSL
jgi:hypothetical protein